MQKAELRVADFVKYRLLWLRTPEQVNELRQRFIAKWQKQKEHGALLLRVRYHFWSALSLAGIVFGWLFAAGSIGNIFIYASEPSYRQDLGGGFVVLMVVFSFFLTIAALRLMQDRKLRRDSYEAVFFGDAA